MIRPGALALIVGLVVPAASVAQDAAEVVHLATGTFWMHAHAEAPFHHEIERLDVVCAGQAACLKQRLRPTVRRLASLHPEPSLFSPVAGYVVARLTVDGAGELAIALDVERADGADAREPWIAAVPDWEQGFELQGVRGRTDSMLEVTGLPIVGAAWILRGGPDWSIRMTKRQPFPG